MPRQSRQIPLLPINNPNGQMFMLTGRLRSSRALPQQTAGHPVALRSHNAALSHPEIHSPPRGHTCQTAHCSEHKKSWGRFQSLPPPLERAFAKQHCRSGDAGVCYSPYESILEAPRQGWLKIRLRRAPWTHGRDWAVTHLPGGSCLSTSTLRMPTPLLFFIHTQGRGQCPCASDKCLDMEHGVICPV